MLTAVDPSLLRTVVKAYLLLAAIALGLWANAAIWLVRPVQAQSDQVAGSVQQMADELRQLVEHGEKCLNPQLCQLRFHHKR
jgi:hypothetical protein